MSIVSAYLVYFKRNYSVPSIQYPLFSTFIVTNKNPFQISFADGIFAFWPIISSDAVFLPILTVWSRQAYFSVPGRPHPLTGSEGQNKPPLPPEQKSRC